MYILYIKISELARVLLCIELSICVYITMGWIIRKCLDYKYKQKSWMSHRKLWLNPNRSFHFWLLNTKFHKHLFNICWDNPPWVLLSPTKLTQWYCQSIMLFTNLRTNLSQITIPFDIVCHASGFHEEGIFSLLLAYTIHTLLVVTGKGRWIEALHLVPGSLIVRIIGFREEERCAAATHAAIFHSVLLDQIPQTIDGTLPLVAGQEGGQIGCVCAEHHQGEEPPHAG